MQGDLGRVFKILIILSQFIVTICQLLFFVFFPEHVRINTEILILMKGNASTL